MKISVDINGHTGTPKTKEKSCKTVNGTHITRNKKNTPAIFADR